MSGAPKSIRGKRPRLNVEMDGWGVGGGGGGVWGGLFVGGGGGVGGGRKRAAGREKTPPEGNSFKRHRIFCRRVLLKNYLEGKKNLAVTQGSRTHKEQASHMREGKVYSKKWNDHSTRRPSSRVAGTGSLHRKQGRREGTKGLPT